MVSKYEPLQRRLRGIDIDQVRLSFDEIEAILGFRLPDSARALPQWWANAGGSHVQARAWMSAGWRTCQVDVPGGAVSFERARQLGHGAVEETAPPFVFDGAIEVDRAALRGGAIRLIEDYGREKGCSPAEAVVGLLNDLVIERRRRLVDWFRENSPRVSDDSTDIIRAERDAR